MMTSTMINLGWNDRDVVTALYINIKVRGNNEQQSFLFVISFIARSLPNYGENNSEKRVLIFKT